MRAKRPIPVEFPDKYRFWQEFVLAAQRGGGRVFVATDARLEPGAYADLEVRVQGEAESLIVTALVEARRPPSLRFSRGIYFRLPEKEVQKLRAALGLLPSDADAAKGRRFRRYHVRWPVKFRTPALLRPIFPEDLSADGIHVEMPERVRRGHVVEMTLFTPQGHELGLAGTVVWTSETSHRVGIRFLFPDDEVAELFAGVLEHAILEEEQKQAAPAQKKQGITILVADDDPLILRMISAALEHQHYRVVRATTGEEALALIRAERPDLVLLDILMPRLDGTTVCRAMRADAELCELPVILVSALDQEGLAKRAEEAGASDYLSKPVAAQDLVRLV